MDGVEVAKSPVIVLPDKGEASRMIAAKIRKTREALSRINSAGGYRAPELNAGFEIEIDVLSSLLREGVIKTWDLSRELHKKYGENYSVEIFNQSCAFAEEICGEHSA